MKIKPLPLSLAITAILLASTVQAAPNSLDDSELEQLTAGSHGQQGSGGAIVGNNATATLDTSAEVNIDGEVQSSAKALNLVNSSESTVANGVNVWGGETSPLEPTGLDAGVPNSAQVKVVQSNEIAQEQRRSASMPSYSRPEADTLVSVDKSGSETHDNKLTDVDSVTDTVRNFRDAYNKSAGKVDTTIMATTGGADAPTIDTNTGKGVAVAGTVDATLDGGDLMFGLAVGGGVTADPDSTSGDFGGMDIGEEGSDVSIFGRIKMPELEINITGAGCGVAMGSCESDGESKEITEDVIDRSTLYTVDSASIGDSHYAESRTEQYRSPFELKNAQAEYIVVDDSTLNVTTSYTLNLSGSAQTSVTAMNVVNATGSAVANGVNVANTTALNSSGLTQVNVIAHSR